METTNSPDRFFIPSGSNIIENSDAGTVTITAPNNYRYVGFDISGGLIVAERYMAGTVSCDCVGTGSCSPFVAGGHGNSVVGCAGVCSDCRMVSTASRIQFKPGAGFIDFDGGTSFVEGNEEFPAAFPAMFNVREVQDSLKGFLDTVFKGRQVPEMEIINGEIVAPTGFVIAVLQVYGRITGTIVPDDAITTQISGKAASCGCSDGACTIEKQGAFGYSIISCVGNCRGVCTLKFSSRSVVYSAETYNY